MGQRVKRIKQQAEDEEKWAKEWEREKQLRMKQREADAAAWRQQLEAEEKRRKEEEERVRKQEEAVLLQQQKLSFSSLPVKETKTVLFEKIVCGSALQQSLMLTQKQLEQEERKNNRVFLTFTLSGIPEKNGHLERSPGWYYSDELIIHRAKTYEIPQSFVATIDRIVIRALPENLYKSVTVKQRWFGWYPLFPRKSMSVQTDDKKTLSIQTQTEVEDGLRDEAKKLMEEVIAEQIQEILNDVLKAEEEEKKRRAREDEEKARKEAEMEALKRKLEEEERQRKLAEEKLKREEEQMRNNLKQKEDEMR